MLKIIAEFDPDDVLPFIGKVGTPKKEYIVGETTLSLKMTSLRLRTFKASRQCVICGLFGTKVLLEQFEGSCSSRPHFNLYGEGTPSNIYRSHAVSPEKSGLILFTKDHVLPKSKGGQNNLANMQSMCVICNGLKANSMFGNKGMKLLRKFYDENIGLDNSELLKELSIKRKAITADVQIK
jgi:hypothetical protein